MNCPQCSAEGQTGRYCANCGVPLLASETTELIGVAPRRERLERDRGFPRWPLFLLGLLVVGVGVLYAQRLEPSEVAEDDQDIDEVRPQPEDVDVVESLPDSDWFVVSTNNETLVRIDPESGEVVDLGLAMRSLGRAWGRVILQDIEGRVYGASPADLASDLPVPAPTPINDTLYSFLPAWVIASSTRDHIWLAEGTGDVVEVSLVTGEVNLVSDRSPRELVSGLTTPRFESPDAGGVYQLQPDQTYQRVLDGRALVEGRGMVLVASCDLELQCGTSWYGSEDLSPIDQPIPDVEGVPSTAWLVGDADFLSLAPLGELVQAGLDGPPAALTSMRSGSIVNLQPAELLAAESGTLDVSPDGALVVRAKQTDFFRNSSVLIRSTETDEVISLGGPTLTGTTPVFIPKP